MERGIKLLNMQILVNSVKFIHPLHIVVLATLDVLDVLVITIIIVNCVLIVTIYQGLIVTTVILDVQNALGDHIHSALHV